MKKVLLSVGLLITVGSVWATVPIEEGEYRGPMNPGPLPQDTVDPLKLRFNYLYEFAQIAEFLARWQLDDLDSADDGGMIEAESGELRDVIQTDNTQEAIWVWARYGELTSDTARFRANIEKAWGYCENFPAWKEEGNPGDNYYRDHNSAWGIASEERFRAVYGDNSYAWYRDTCVEYIKTHPLSVFTKINRFVNGWCAGWLYHYGVQMDDQEARDSACSFADTLLGWIDNMTPEYGLTEEGWAMSSGTTAWGICNSAFQRDTLRGKVWIAENGQYLDTFQAWKNVGVQSWDNAWNVGYANGHGAMYDISHDPAYARHHRWLTHKLLSYDTDSDGGIMANTQDADTIDMSWVSAYLAMMGLDRLIGEVYDYDAGALQLVGIYDGDRITPGTRIDIRAVISNYGRQPLTGVKVNLSGSSSGSASSDLVFLGMDTITLVSNWPVPDSAVLTLAVAHPKDENPANDTLIVRLNKAAGITEGEIVSSVQLNVRSLTGSSCKIAYAFWGAPSGELALYDALGARVKQETLMDSEGVVVWDLSSTPIGVYFLRLKVGKASTTVRLITLR